MTKNLSLFLDVFRFIAAMSVFMTHSYVFYFPELSKLGKNGSEAVACFFVLSGFVIAFVADQKESDIREYTISRIARIYPVAMGCIALSVVFDSIGVSISPVNYLNKDYYSYDHGLISILSMLGFLNEIWFLHIFYGSIEPYWSLGFEVWYYVLFGAAFYLRGLVRVSILLVVVALIGPKILSYLPLWLLGCFTYYLVRGEDRFSRFTPVAAAMFLVLLCPLYIGLKEYFGAVPGIQHFHFSLTTIFTWLYFNVVGLMVALSIFSVSRLLGGVVEPPQNVQLTIRWLAGGSFTLYLLHQPTILLLISAFPNASTSLVGKGSIFVGALLICYLIASLLERRKRAFRRAIAWIWPSKHLASQSRL